MTTLREAAQQALEAGLTPQRDEYLLTEMLERFAALVEQRLIASGYRKCAEGQGDSQFCELLERAVMDEREACARVCEEIGRGHNSAIAEFDCAAAIRERSKT